MQLVFNNNDVVIMQNEETAIKLFKVQLPFKKAFVFMQFRLLYLALRLRSGHAQLTQHHHPN